MESSVVEQADARAVTVCVGAGADGADGENESIARTFDVGARESDELTSGTCDACGFASEGEFGAQARKHGPLKSVARYFCNEEEARKRVMHRVTQR